MTKTDGAIGIDLAASGSRALYLQRRTNGSAVAGYAVPKNSSAEPTAVLVLNLIGAINAPEGTPVALAWSEASLSAPMRDSIVAEVQQAGYVLSTEDRATARARSLPRGDDGTGDVALVHCRIPATLLATQAGLTTRTLAGAAGAALGVLGLGYNGGDRTLTASDAPPAPALPPVPSTLPRASDAPPAPRAPPTPTPADARPEPASSAPVAKAGPGTSTSAEAARTQRAPKPVATVAPAPESRGPGAAPPAPPAPEPAPPSAHELIENGQAQDIGSLPAATATPVGASTPNGRGLRAWMVFPLLGVLFVLGVVLGQCAKSDDVAQPVPTAVPAATEVPTVAPVPSATAEPTATAEPEPTATAEATPAPVDQFPPLSDLPEQAAIFRPPTLFLQGPVSSQATIDVIYSRAVEALGAANVVNEYVVHPDAPPFESGNTIRVEAALLFELGSAEIGPDFIDVLELARLLFELNPQMTGIVEGHTDVSGGDEPNQVLSERRANVVRDYLLARGVGADRITAVGFGSSEPVADNGTEEGRQRNRRIEFDLRGLLDPRPS